ncbi:MAG: hypothetical protein EBW19_12850, partial [Betaproteobacteria bacterium]|nr:hypothetical protein [Betaproteobacteria bacterium]
MALLQISEPGESPDPHQIKRAVGIDLGTTHSLIASVRSGLAECLSADDGSVLLPSQTIKLRGLCVRSCCCRARALLVLALRFLNRSSD